MKNKSLIILLLLPILVKAQFIPLNTKKYVDSLNYILKSNAADSLKASANFSLAKYWLREKEYAKGKLYLEAGKKHSKNSGYMQAFGTYISGLFYVDKNNDIAKKLFLKADTFFSRIKSKDSYLARAQLWQKYVRIIQMDGQDLEALDLLINKVLPFSKLSGKQSYIGLNYCNIGVMLFNLKENDRAALYFQKSLEIFEHLPIDTANLAVIYTISIKNYVSINHLSEAKHLLEKCEPLFKSYTNNHLFVDYCEAKGGYFAAAKQYPEALLILNKGIKIAEMLKLDAPRIRLLDQKYQTFILQKNYKAAKEIILEIISYNNEDTFLEDKIADYKEAYKTYDKLNDIPEAYKWLKKYTILNDSVNRNNLKEQINKLEIKFKTAENQKKIAELNTANQKANLSAKNSRLLNWLFGVISLLILSVFIFGFYYYRNQKKLTEQREEIRLSNAMLQGQEMERFRVARDLHDGLGNLLTVIKFNLGQLVKEKPVAELDEITHQLDHSISELRRIAHDMMPEMLLNIGLEAAIKDLCESLTSDDLEIDCQLIKIKSTIPQSTQVSIYRIIQELLTNVVKHAQAKNVLLQCTQHKNVFFITLDDDGKGFHADQQKEKAGIGLNNIKSRIAYLNGKMEIVSRTNQPGTSINIEFNVKT